MHHSKFNVYEILELDPALTGRAEAIAHHQAEKDRYNSVSQMSPPQLLARRELLIINDLKIEEVLNNDKTRLEHAAAYRKRLDEGESKARSMLSLVYARATFTPTDVHSIVRKYELPEWYVRKLLTKAGVVDATTSAKVPPKQTYKPPDVTDRIVVEGINRDLKSAGAATLYNFMGSGFESTASEAKIRSWCATMDHKLAINKDAAENQRDTRLVGSVREHLLKPENRKKYDEYLKHAPLFELEPLIQLAAGQDKVVTREWLDSIIKDGESAGLAASQVEAFVEYYISTKHGWKLLTARARASPAPVAAATSPPSPPPVASKSPASASAGSSAASSASRPSSPPSPPGRRRPVPPPAPPSSSVLIWMALRGVFQLSLNFAKLVSKAIPLPLTLVAHLSKGLFARKRAIAKVAFAAGGIAAVGAIIVEINKPGESNEETAMRNQFDGDSAPNAPVRPEPTATASTTARPTATGPRSTPTPTATPKFKPPPPPPPPNQPPTVTFSKPSQSVWMEGDTLALELTVTDPDNDSVEVRYSVDGERHTAPSRRWIAYELKRAGPLEMQIQAVDEHGLKSTTKILDLTVERNPGKGWKLRELQTHSKSVTAVALTKDGKQFASAGRDSLIHYGSTAINEAPKELAELADMIHSLAFSNDGSLVAAGGENGVLHLWRTRDGSLLRRIPIEGDKPAIRSISFHPDGELVAAGTKGGYVGIWNLATGKAAAYFRSHDSVLSIAFSPSGNSIASGGLDRQDDHRVYVRDLGGRLVSQHFGHRDCVNSVAFSPDGSLIASAGEDKKVLVWRVGTKSSTFHVANFSDDLALNAAAFCGSTVLCASAASKTMNFWRIEDGKSLAIIPQALGRKVTSLAFDGNGEGILSGASDGSVHLWFR